MAVKRNLSREIGISKDSDKSTLQQLQAKQEAIKNAEKKKALEHWNTTEENLTKAQLQRLNKLQLDATREVNKKIKDLERQQNEDLEKLDEAR